jgi:hypothetical protein
VHGCKHLEEISAGWICASRTLAILSLLAKKWQVELPEEAAGVLARTDRKNVPFARPSDPLVDPQQTFLNLTAAAVKAQQRSEAAPAVTMSPTQQLAQSTGTYSVPAPQMSAAQTQNYPATDVPPQNNSTDQQMTDQARLYQAFEKVPSPGEMFGGVEQLIRDSNNWIYRDSEQVATGFDNWDDLSMDPLTWTNGVAPIGTTLDFVPQATQSMQHHANMPMAASTQGPIFNAGMAPANTASNTAIGANGNMAMATGYPMMRWLSNADDMATYYNEGAFYQ